MFPQELDGARILYYTADGDYGDIFTSRGEVVDCVRYMAIGQYPRDKKFYLFRCNKDYNVAVKWADKTLEESMARGAGARLDVQWIKA